MFRSGFATLVGRPNVGKSTLVNAICGEKVSIVSDKPQTTRTRVRGILNRPDAQLVLVDTPGLHKPSTALGERVNANALDSMDDVDVVCLVLDATKPFGRGDEWVAARTDIARAVVVVNKVDRAGRTAVLRQLSAASALGAERVLPPLGPLGRGRRGARRPPRRPSCRRAPRTSRPTRPARCPRRPGWPSSSASSSSR